MESLNEKQKDAVLNGDGPVVIQAGPGTGKTKTLVARVDYLLNEKKVDPAKILILTFTKKATQEIKERLGNKSVWVETFHGLAYKLLTQNDQELWLVNQEQKQRLISTLTSESVRDISLLISRFKNGETDLPVGKLVEKYQAELEKNSYCDFDDLQLRLIEKWNSFSIKPSFDFVLVDEFQDTSQIEYQLLNRVLSKDKNIWVIGDPNQSIYGFRGISSNVFAQFEKDFLGCQTVVLNTNYRSGQTVLSVSHQLVKDSVPLIMGVKRPSTVKLINTLNEYSEADWILRFINQCIGGLSLAETDQHEGSNLTATFKDFAIIARTHSLTKAVVKKLKDSGIPYQESGVYSWLSTKENRHIFRSLKYLVNKEQIATTSWLEETLDPALLPCLKDIDVSIPVSEVIKKVLMILGYPPQSELMSMVVRFDTQKGGLEKLVGYWDELNESNYIDSLADKVSVLTMHAAKGLEFKYVFVCGFEEGLIPYVKKGAVDLPEEKRLLYVALTRAQEGLYLLSVKFRNRRPQSVSRFFNDLCCSDLIEETDEDLPKLETKRKMQKLKGKQLGLF